MKLKLKMKVKIKLKLNIKLKLKMKLKLKIGGGSTVNRVVKAVIQMFLKLATLLWGHYSQHT